MPTTASQPGLQHSGANRTSALKQLHTIPSGDLFAILKEAHIPIDAAETLRATNRSLEDFNATVKRFNPDANPGQLLDAVLAANPDDGGARTWALMRHSEGLIRSMECPPDYVNMYDGKHSSKEPRRTSCLNGCIATLVYAEDSEGPHLFVTHYAGLDFQENITKLTELRLAHLSGSPTFSSGLLLIPGGSNDPANDQLELALRSLFPGITVQRISYKGQHDGEVRADPLTASWESSQLGKHSFREVR